MKSLKKERKKKDVRETSWRASHKAILLLVFVPRSSSVSTEFLIGNHFKHFTVYFST